MGCGQSKIGIYQRKSKNKKNGSKRSGEGGQSEEETEEAEDRVGAETKESAEESEGENGSDSVNAKIKQMAQQQTGGAILAQSDISSSQLDFFKMLDEKIENGPDYEEEDEEEEKQRLANLVKEWRAACQARQQRKNGPVLNDPENWPSPNRGKPYIDDYYQNRGINAVDTQRFPTGYSQCPPNNSINIHLQNSFRSVAPPFTEQPRMQLPRPPYPNPNFHPYQPQPDGMNHSDESNVVGHPLSTVEPPNPLRTNYPQVLMRQSSMNSQIQHYPPPPPPPENQRLYTENIRQFPDSPRAYPDRPYTVPRNIQPINVLHEQRLYLQDGRPYQDVRYQDGPRQNIDQQRMMMAAGPTPYHDPQRLNENSRILPENQRIYHERLLENQRQYTDTRGIDPGQRTHPQFQRPPLLTQRSFQEPTRIYRDLDNEECYRGFQDSMPDGSSPRVHNQTHFKMGRSLSVDVQYVAGPPPPREMIPLQGAPGPPQGSPRPMVARGLQMNMHRLPANSVVQFRKPRGAFTELA